jgi:CRP-like cAMP-binding protein
MPTIRQIKDQADSALFTDQAREALALYTHIVGVQPANLDARLRVGDALLAMGEVQRAAVVYAALARHAMLAGYPLRALVALKVLSALEPKLGVLLKELATLYGRDSQRLGKSVRRALPDLNDTAPAPAPSTLDAAALIPHAERVASNYDTAGLIYPDKLMPIPLFSLLDAEEFGAVLTALRLVRARPGTAIVREGAEGRSFFVLARGEAEVSATRAGEALHLARLLEGAIFGEMALLSAAPRTATVTTSGDCDLLEFDCAALSDASATLQNLAAALGGFARERLLRNVVTTSPLFGPLDPKQRADLMRRFVAVEAAPDSSIIVQGDEGQGLYVILRGEVVVTRTDADSETELARLGPGELFGEISLIRNEATTASVRTGALSTTLLVLSRDYFGRLLVAMPELRGYLERLSEDRLMDLRISMIPQEPAGIDDGTEDEIDVEISL